MKLIMLGGGYLQVPSIQRARQYGFEVVLCDRDPNCEGVKHVEHYHQVSIDDVDSISALLGIYPYVRACYATVDPGITTEQEINRRLGLQAVPWIEDKWEVKGRLQTAGIPTPDGFVVDYPAIVKPVSGSGSVGVMSISPPFLVEERLDGKHIDCNGCFVDGQYHALGTSQRYFSPPPFCIGLWGHQPTTLTPDQEAHAHDITRRAALALGIDYGPVKSDLIWTHAGPYVIEITPRFHGQVSSIFVTEKIAEYTPADFWFAHLSGKSVIRKPPVAQFAGWKAIFPTVSGRVRSVHTYPDSQVWTSVRPDEYVSNVHMDNTTLAGFVWAQADCLHHLKEQLDQEVVFSVHENGR